jgi:hypothetical protein
MSDPPDDSVPPNIQTTTTLPAPPSDPPAAADDGAKLIFGLPAAMFVKGGTHTSGHDRMVAEAEADAEHRRDLQDAERRLARVPVEQGGGKIFENRFNPGAHGSQVSPMVLLKYLTPSGEERYENGDQLQCLADIKVGIDPLHPNELTLILVCPKCQESEPQGQNQIQIRQTNKKWELDLTTAGQPFDWVEWVRVPGGWKKNVFVFPSAGVVRESEPFSCPKCGWRARIEKNRVRPDR